MLRLDSFLPISIRRNHRRHHPSHGNGDNPPGRCGNQQTNFHVLPAPTPVRGFLLISFNFHCSLFARGSLPMLEFLMTLCVNKITVMKSPWRVEFFTFGNVKRVLMRMFLSLFLILKDLKISIVRNLQEFFIPRCRCDRNIILVTERSM